MKSDIIFRKWETSDNSQIAMLESKYFQDPWNEQMLESSREQPLFIGVVAEVENAVKGYIGARYVLDQGEIMLIAVDGHLRRQGIATQLLKCAEIEMQEKGVEVVFLEVRVSNEIAQNFYQKFGFEPISIRKKYYSNGEDAIIMAKQI